MQKVLCFLSVNPEYVEFGIPQLKSILKDCQIPLQVLFQQELEGQNLDHSYQINNTSFKHFPCVVLTVPDFQKHRTYFQQACKQSVMTYKMILLISQGQNYQQLIKKADEEILKKYCRNEKQQVVCDFNSRNRVLPKQQQMKKIHSILGTLNILGQVNFKHPKIRYQLIQHHQWYQKHHLESSDSTLRKVFFGIQLSCNHIATAKFNYKYILKNRIYLGPTSAFNDLAFLMCNQGLVKQGSFVLDPFVGTGGLLIPPATKGAYTFGSDLDIRVLNGYSVGRINKNSPFYDPDKKLQLFTPKINLNFDQYGLPTPNIIRIDSTKLTLRAEQLFDVIITDPPYGIRAMSRSVTKQESVQEPKLEKVGERQQNASLRDIQYGQMEKDRVESEETVGGKVPDGQKEQIGEKEGQNVKQIQKLTEKQLFNRERKRGLKQKKRKRMQMLPEEQKLYREHLSKKMNKQRVQDWQKYDKTKIGSTERQIMFRSLLNVALKYLKHKGRLVFLYPVYEEEGYTGIGNIPQHKGFTLIDLSQNKMSRGNSRILVTLQKE